MQSAEFPQYQFVRARSWTSGRISGQPTVIIIHTTEGSEGRTSAEDGAAYDARRTDGTSCHFFVDQDTTVQCVYTWDEAHHARRHGNDVGIGIEVCGKAGQTDAQWADAASAGAVEQAARLGVALRRKYGKWRFPLVNLTPTQLRNGERGFAEHLDATRAWPEDGGSHWDPGPNFPWSKMFNRILTLEAVVLPVVMEDIGPGKLPKLLYGMRDPIMPDASSHVRRAQRLLGVAADGIYGDQTAAQIAETFGTDGRTLDITQWRRLIAIRSA